MRINTDYLNKTVNKMARAELQGEDLGALPIFDIWHETVSQVREDKGSPRGTLDYNLTKPPGTSYTGLIARDGTYYPYVDPVKYVAYHAGVNSKWLGKVGWDCNVWSNGYELDGPNDGTPITAAQKVTVAEIALQDWERFRIPLCSLYHPEHGEVAPKDASGKIYKTDPKGTNIDEIINPLGLSLFAPPRCSQHTFTRVLDSRQSPAAPHAQELYELCLAKGIDPAVALAFFVHESKAGTAGIVAQYQTFNWGNVRSPFNKSRADVIQTPRGNFAKFSSWTDGLLDYIERLQNWYVKDRGAYTVELAIPVYAPSSDGNSVSGYIRAVRDLVAAWEGEMVSQLPVASVSGSTVLVPAPVQAYWINSGGIWRPDRYALGLLQGRAYEGSSRLFIFERGVVRYSSEGEVTSLLLSEALKHVD